MLEKDDEENRKVLEDEESETKLQKRISQKMMSRKCCEEK
jgi:hypothetical protein